MSVVAQLIPLLLITLLIERRLLHRIPETGRSRTIDGVIAAFVGFTCLAFVVTEAEVLVALRSGHADSRVDDDIRATLVVAAAALIAPLLQRAFIAVAARPRERLVAVTGGLVAFAIVFVVAAVSTR